MADIHSLKRELNEIQESYPTWSSDNAFVHWFLRAFLVPEDDMAAKAVTGAPHDKEVDAVFVDDRAEKIFVVQGKCHLRERPPSEGRSDVISFAKLSWTLSGSDSDFAIFSKGVDPLVRDKLVNARQRIKKRGFALHLYYVTTGTCSSPLKAEAEAIAARATGRVELSIFDRREILALLTDYLGGAAPPVPYLDLKIDVRGIVGSDGVIQRFDQETGIESWILTIAGRDVGALYERSGDRLFARNIRGFLGNTAINEGMANTLKREAQHFWYFNNGITIVCDSARKTAERGASILRVANPQVINGQQTTRVLEENGQSRASVLVRVINIPRDGEHGSKNFEELVSDIVAATNWQNAILYSDLRANDARQVSIERDFAKLRYHYLRKRQTKREARRLLGAQHWFRIKKDELAQAVAACEFDPLVVRSGKEGLFKKPYYDQIFDGRQIHQYLSAYWLSRVVKRNASRYPNRAYAKWHVLHLLWNLVGSDLRKKMLSQAFRNMCERNRWSRHLDNATWRLYLTAMDFYRKKKGIGATAVDISNFFYRSKQHIAFEKFWRASSRRAAVKHALRRFLAELKENL